MNARTDLPTQSELHQAEIDVANRKAAFFAACQLIASGGWNHAQQQLILESAEQALRDCDAIGMGRVLTLLEDAAAAHDFVFIASDQERVAAVRERMNAGREFA